MSKEFKSIEQALNLKTLCSDKDNGIYLNEELADAMENFCSSVEGITKAKEDLEQQISSLVQEHETALDALEQKHKQTDAVLQEEKAELNKKIASLQHDLEQANATISEKEKELDELAKLAPQSPAPQKPTSTATSEKRWEDLSLAEKKAAFLK